MTTEFIIRKCNHPDCASEGQSFVNDVCPRCERAPLSKPKVANERHDYSHDEPSNLEAMDKRICFTVYGQPIPKGRPRFDGKKAFTPIKTRRYETVLRQESERYCESPFKTPVAVWLVFYREIQAGKKPDIDNLAKAVLDALEGIAYTNDDLVRKLYLELHYVGSNPKVAIEITSLNTLRVVGKYDV